MTEPPSTDAATSADPPPQQQPPRHRYRLQIAIEGRIRFLSHLESIDTLLAAVRRSGVRMALSEGFRPKPRIKVAMPRPVAVEAWADLVEIELAEPISTDELALRMGERLPTGVTLQRVEELAQDEKPAASRVAGATWRWQFEEGAVDQAALERAVQALLDSERHEVERSSPNKATRIRNVRPYIGDMAVVPESEGGVALRAFIRLTGDGSAKPQEVVTALAQVGGIELEPRRTVRESISLAEQGDGHVAEPAIVGADVPDGPEKPWGSC